MTERLTFGYGTKQPVTREVAPPAPAERAEAVAAAPAAPRAAAREKTDWAFVGLMCFTALLFFRPQDTIPALGALHLAELAALGALAALVAGRLGRGLPATRITPELMGVAALGGIILATAPFSIWMGGAVGTFTGMFVKVMLIFVLMVNTLTSPKRMEQFIWLLVGATAYIAFRAVFDYARGINLIENGRVQGAVGGMFRNPNDLALNLVAVMPLAVSLAMRPIAVIRRIVAVGCAVLMLGAIVATQSRSGTVGLAAMVLVLSVHLVRRKPGLLLAGAMVMVLALPLLPSSYWERLSSITDGSRDQTGSREARSILLRESFATFLAHPFTGVGAGQFKNYKPEQREEAWRETHNVVLQVASELGILGLAVFLFLVGRAAYAPVQTRRLLRRASHIRTPRRKSAATPDPSRPAAVVTVEEREMLDAHSVAMAAAIAGWFVCALFASVAYHWTFYYLLALAAAPRDMIADRLTPPRRRGRKAPAAAVAVMGARA